ncbi:hypothetical protein EIP91_009377 [Steccherinum ochraceum]|uniref:NADP-dependent oxidoreductase domain-containing protein n=1 Tax=Steccherinum ochraceum TaxID=92696 RepID=A0A4R0R1Q5_9APHY|nr:hypothetical protein EIP91_009377 [Steccherinum ochraceum]
MAFAPPPPPKTNLGRYRQFSPRAGVHLSPIGLGAMSIGDQWEKIGFGAMNKESSFKLLDAYYDAGGNFIDTANNYQDGSSERFLGEWMEQRGIRDQIFLATKYTNNTNIGPSVVVGQKVLSTGNNLKSLTLSVERSLKHLRTNYIDLLYVHWWDYATSVEEVMDGLHNLVASGKVLYIGVSDTPAHIVSEANTYAKYNGKTPFVAYQGAWSVLERDLEREILPMARRHNMAIVPWNVLASGKIRTDEEEERRRQTGEQGRAISMVSSGWERNENEKKMAKALEQVAKEVGAKHITAVAIAYVMQKAPHVFPIIGGRKIEHLMSNIEALSVSLSNEHIKFIESVLPFDFGFPYQYFPIDEYAFLWKAVAHTEKWPKAEPIRPTPQ